MVTYSYILRQGEWKSVIYFHYITLFYMLFIMSPIIMTTLRWIISYIFFLSSQSRGFFSGLWSFSSSSFKAPFKSVIILLFRWGENYSGIRQHNFNNVIIFILLFPILFTKQTNILFASLSIPVFFFPPLDCCCLQSSIKTPWWSVLLPS